MKATTTLKISISGVRGIIGDSLTPQLTTALASTSVNSAIFSLRSWLMALSERHTMMSG